MRCLVVDRSPESARSLSSVLAREADIQLLGCWRTWSDAAPAIGRDRPDVVFVDLDGGADHGRVLGPPGLARTPIAVVAVIGAVDEAVAAFAIGAIHCLLKPATSERIQEALARARARQTLAAQIELANRLLDARPPTASPRPAPRFVVRDRQGVRIVDARAVSWIEAQGNYVCLHLQGERDALLRTTMNAVQAQAGAEFVRIHRSAAVREEMIRELRKGRRGWEVILRDATTLRVGRRYMRGVRKFVAMDVGARVGPWPSQEMGA